ncbi:MAG: DCL family protein [Enterobacterales bacterium]|nr:DCL family protein [Enterobacterales bacterium]
MARKPVTLGEYNFPTKKEAKELYSKILNDTDLEQSLECKNYDYVMALLLNHPRADQKIGCGVNAIKVSTGYTSSNRCFHVVRTDGTIEDFSIGKCIDGDHSEFHKFCVACRKSVEADVRAYKRKYFEENSDNNGLVKCQSTNQLISYDDAHADHREPFTFSAIAHFFYKSKGLDLGAIEYETEGKYGNEFTDSELINSFREWHKENAKIRIVHGKTNLSKGYLGRVKATKADGNV